MILKHIDCCDDRISYISHVWRVFWYTWNLKFRNNIEEGATKIWHSLLSLATLLSFSLRMILLFSEHFEEKKGENVFQKLLFSTNFLMSKLLKYNILVVLSSFLQKFLCFLYFNLSSWDLVPKKLLRNLDLFIIALCNFFVIKGTSFARRYFCLTGAYLSNILNIVSL